MLERIRAARQALPSQVRRTPVLPSPHGWWQCENLQTTGSYKLRAAFHVLMSLTAEERQRGAALCQCSVGGSSSSSSSLITRSSIRKLRVTPC